MKRIRILLIEDNRLLREGLAAMLKEQPDITVVAARGNGETLRKSRRMSADVVLLDLGLRFQKSLGLIALVRRIAPNARIIVMGLAPVTSEIVEFVKAGVSGFVLMDATFDDFMKTIRSVAAGVKVLPPSLTGSLFFQIMDRAPRKGKDYPFPPVKMTSREREVVVLIAEGLSNKDIAVRLHLAVDTVKSHVHNILDKLALHTRLEIASYAHARSSHDGQSRHNDPSAD
jgi:two-component system NarL family response regulator